MREEKSVPFSEREGCGYLCQRNTIWRGVMSMIGKDADSYFKRKRKRSKLYN